MATTHEWMFYEVMWRAEAGGRPVPLPWWVQQYFRHWVEPYDSGLFSSKEAAFSSNAHYRYWNMVGVKDHRQESLIGQAGEIEPVYDQYALSFFLFEPSTKKLHFPQHPVYDGSLSPLEQGLEDGYLPVVNTSYRSPMNIIIEQKVIATTVGADQRSVVLVRTTARLSGSTPANAWLCISVSPTGPTGFQRHDKAGRYIADRRLSFIKYLGAEKRVFINSSWGPVFDKAPVHFGTYGNGSSYDPDFYIDNSPYHDLASSGGLNGWNTATDHIAGLCKGVFAWPINLSAGSRTFSLDIWLPVDDYRGPHDLMEIISADADSLENNNRTFWTNKLDNSGLQASLSPVVRHLFDLYRTCRANLLILSDHGQIHPGPTIYDSFWVRDSSVEGIACSLSGDKNLASRQFGHHYPTIFNLGYERLGPVSLHGFFGGEHEKNDFEWDSNGQALWAIGRFDRINGSGNGFGASMFSPYVIEGARWIRDNRSPYGIMHSGWSAEHIGEKHKPHFWDDLWGLAGLWEAAKLAERIGAPEAGEIWWAYNDLNRATADSIRWVLDEQRRRGFWETFIPTGPGDPGRLDSTMVGVLAYFHPCRLYMGAKLGADIDWAAKMTLETIWAHFMEGGFRHDTAWYCYGPYLTLQLAHAFLLTGDVEKMDKCLAWAVNAGYAKISRYEGESSDRWQVVSGAWNEQHCYPAAKDFAEVPQRWWYMGDIPHGWACAEYLLLLRDILFFEADEDNEPHIYIAPGVMPHWLGDGKSISVSDAPTVFGSLFGYKLTHNQAARSVEIQILQPPPSHVSFIYPCRFGSGVSSVTADGSSLAITGNDVKLPANTTQATVRYL
ncbi:MAG TPA: hypothetical protein ENG83_04410 [Nitrospirae bacterium]|nr:hypothetical protein BMS3Abin06_00607 [bacterium BMS3Abin06]HDH11434.1 hypothetical protein [Nitrospirota bacterium]HDL21217.1 hypothetical protein [Nitrospirota bacterium]HDZ01412.1 hypothetical protein [Nitrospirota bacterium]